MREKRRGGGSRALSKRGKGRDDFPTFTIKNHPRRRKEEASPDRSGHFCLVGKGKGRKERIDSLVNVVRLPAWG